MFRTQDTVFKNNFFNNNTYRIDVSYNSSSTQIISNIIHDNGWRGILIRYDSINTDISNSNIYNHEGWGIMIDYGASGSNVINNFIHSNYGGIIVDQETSLQNSISENSIYNNESLGIRLTNDGNTEIPSPVITAFNIPGGTASGTACPNCTVELFSDKYGEGRVHEYTTIADPNGNWSLDKVVAFQGPEITATATDTAGNTSEFGQDWPPDPPLPPAIASPIRGVTNNPSPLFSGTAQMGNKITLYDGSTEITTFDTNDQNQWQGEYWEDFTVGNHDFAVTATTYYGSSTAAHLDLTINSNLNFDPVKVTFVQQGINQHPRDTAGCVDPSNDLTIDLWPKKTVTVNAPVSDPAATVYVEVNSIRYDLLDPEEDGVFTGEFPSPVNGPVVIVLVVDDGVKIQTMQIGSTIDPDRYVYDLGLTQQTGITQTLSGVEVTLFVFDSVRERWFEWDAPLYDQVNSQKTGEDGYFSFFTPPGQYKLFVDGMHQGYFAHASPIISFIDEPVRFNVPLNQIKEWLYLSLLSNKK